MRVAHIVEGSRTNGPGVRSVLFVQGCSMRCKGCYNEHLQTTEGGQEMAPVDVAARLTSLGNPSITISGGEPLEQAEDLALVLEYLHLHFGERLDVLVFTGAYNILGHLEYDGVAHYSVAFIAGPYEDDNRHETDGRFAPWGLLASKNQCVVPGRLFNCACAPYPMRALWDTGVLLAYGNTAQAEVLIDMDGTSIFTGFPEKEDK